MDTHPHEAGSRPMSACLFDLRGALQGLDCVLWPARSVGRQHCFWELWGYGVVRRLEPRSLNGRDSPPPVCVQARSTHAFLLQSSWILGASVVFVGQCRAHRDADPQFSTHNHLTGSRERRCLALGPARSIESTPRGLQQKPSCRRHRHSAHDHLHPSSQHAAQQHQQQRGGGPGGSAPRPRGALLGGHSIRALQHQPRTSAGSGGGSSSRKSSSSRGVGGGEEGWPGQQQQPAVRAHQREAGGQGGPGAGGGAGPPVPGRGRRQRRRRGADADAAAGGGRCVGGWAEWVA